MHGRLRRSSAQLLKNSVVLSSNNIQSAGPCALCIHRWASTAGKVTGTSQVEKQSTRPKLEIKPRNASGETENSERIRSKTTATAVDVYDAKAEASIYEQRLAHCAVLRWTKFRNGSLESDNVNLNVKDLRAKLFGLAYRTAEALSITDVDVETAARHYERHALSSSKLPPLNMKKLIKAKDKLNDQLYVSNLSKLGSYCQRQCVHVEKNYETSLINLRTALLYGKIPLALPVVSAFFTKRDDRISRVVRVDPSFNLDFFDQPKFQTLICMILQEAIVSDARKSYIDWLLSLLTIHQITPCFELCCLAVLLMHKINQPQLIDEFYKNWAASFVDRKHPALRNIGLSKSNIAMLEEILPKLAKMPANLFRERFVDNHVASSILTPKDKLVPLDCNKLPPQLDLSDIISPAELRRKFAQQLAREKAILVSMDSLDEAPSAKKRAKQHDNSFDFKSVLKTWHEKIKSEINEELHAESRSQGLNKGAYDVLHVVDLDALVDKLIDTALNMAAEGNGKISQVLCTELGEFIFASFYGRYLESKGYYEKLDVIYPKFVNYFYKARGTNINHGPRETWLGLQEKHSSRGPGIHSFPTPWPWRVYDYLGKFLVTILLKHCQVPARFFNHKIDKENKLLSCFSCTYTAFKPKKTDFTRSKINLFISPHFFFVLFVRRLRKQRIVMPSTYIPMLVPPVPWCGQSHGGYLASPSYLVREHREGSDGQNICVDHVLGRTMSDHPDMNGVYDSIYAFSSVPWKINRFMFDVLQRLYKEGGDYDLDIPFSVKRFAVFLEKNPPGANEKGATEYHKKYLKRKAEAANYSLRLTLLYQLCIANLVRKEKAFWFPTNMDFRGRCYDIPPVFNHIGSDVTRSLLAFAQGRPLGNSGLHWLKLHLANLSGKCKKLTYGERLDFVARHMPLVLDSARRPMDGLCWWKTLDEPFQALSCCEELSRALSLRDPASHVSHLPVHQDGSCNGLQHYAVLGRDAPGAMKVNLIPAERPQDVYQAVADMVEDFRKRDKVEDTQSEAKLLEGCVTRRVVKQTVMTQVYGVTEFGGRVQIKSQLHDLDEMKGATSAQVDSAAKYLVRAVFDGVGNLFTQTGKIKTWLRTLAYLLGEAGLFTEWTTPLGLPVIQPYQKSSPKQMASVFKNELSAGKISLLHPNCMKQKTAFPPNYIHSLDATHMLLTSFRCYKNGISFVHIHDCFWTHAADISKMNSILREEFIRLHSVPLLQDLADYVALKLLPRIEDENHRARVYRHLQSIPATGELNLEVIKDSTFFFS